MGSSCKSNFNGVICMHFCNGRIRLSKNEKYQYIRFAFKTKDRTNCNYSTIKIIVYVIPLYTIFSII